ncbi:MULTISPECIES: hypothetical protein [Saccharibacillus]|uniref:Uncharacterized protein n=1 Tax=Saccharibacillus endophyticus TaxID=2060666 RepID=A0ABQ1ZS72_9BACL|nr:MULTISPECIES: hypothetical protein [Saccharibacillus]GGH73296.1 hypothetical protein GCM10007362_12250 [Saccharibacillus endophyticus]
MNNFKSTLMLALITSVVGLLIAVFAFLPVPFNALVGLLAAGLVVWYFRKLEERGPKIMFIVFVVVYFLFFTVLIASIRYRMGLI